MRFPNSLEVSALEGQQGLTCLGKDRYPGFETAIWKVPDAKKRAGSRSLILGHKDLVVEATVTNQTVSDTLAYI